MEGKKKHVSGSTKAGIQFPVGRVKRHLRNGRYAERISADAPVYTAAVLEYLVSEILELAGNAARDNKHKRLTPRDIQLAVRSDTELAELLRDVGISQGGTMPHIYADLLPEKKAKKKKQVKAQ